MAGTVEFERLAKLPNHSGIDHSHIMDCENEGSVAGRYLLVRRRQACDQRDPRQSLVMRTISSADTNPCSSRKIPPLIA